MTTTQQTGQPITGKTQLFGVIGHPIEHSLSPIMHNAAIAELGVDYIYVAFPIAPTDLATAIAGFRSMGVQGFNVTIPHKQAIIPLLSQVSELAQAVGAVNTVWRTPTGWSGTNTDVAGFTAPLTAMRRDWQGSTAIVLGAGGAARAVVAACGQLGCDRIHVVGRDRSKLHPFLQSWQGSPWANPLRVHGWDDLEQLLPQASLLVNTTPVGMAPQPEQSPLSPAQVELLPASAVVYDLIYVPSPTRLLRLAQQRDLLTIDGLEMLVQQGAEALQLWLQRPVPVAVMRRSLQVWLGLA